jgi:predicted O-methyltransferase YrrM
LEDIIDEKDCVGRKGLNMDKKEEIKKVLDNVPGMMEPDMAEYLYDRAYECLRGPIVEVGSYMGRSTICIARGSKSGGRIRGKKPITVYSVDPHNGGGTTPDPTWRDSFDPGTPDRKYYTNTGITFPAFKERLIKCKVNDIVIPLVNYSELAYKAGWNGPIEMLFIDGEHRYNYVKMDMEMWGKHVISGGIIIFHDSGHPGVKRVIDEMVRNNSRYTDFNEYPVFNVRVKIED